MRRWTLAVAVLAVALGGCEDRRKKAIERVGHDEELLRKVGARRSTRWSATRRTARWRSPSDRGLPAHRDARKEATVPASQPTLDTLKSQVDRVAQACP